MGFDRQIVRLMAVVIVMIAACIAPSGVLAHQGHVHQGHVHGGPAPAKALSQGGVATMSAMGETAFGAALPDAERPSVPCNGLCCGLACCVAGVLPGVALLPAPSPRRRLALPAATLGHPGTGPEALPEPPRLLA